MYKGVIYKFTNVINQKMYIGQTTRPNVRIIEHKSHSKNKGKNEHFYNAIRKYGWDNFKFEIIESVCAQSLDELHSKLDLLETYWIEKLQTTNKKLGYNFSTGGAIRGPKARAIEMYTIDGEYIKTFSSYKEIQEEFNVKTDRSVHYFCNHKNTLFKNKYILVWKGNEVPQYTYPKSKYIYFQYDLNKNLISTWRSVCEIQKKLGYDPSSIIKCCLHPDKKPTYKGYIWCRENKL